MKTMLLTVASPSFSSNSTPDIALELTAEAIVLRARRRGASRSFGSIAERHCHARTSGQVARCRNGMTF